MKNIVSDYNKGHIKRVFFVFFFKKALLYKHISYPDFKVQLCVPCHSNGSI